MATLSNTEVFGFTRVPRVIRKEWSAGVVDTTNMRFAQPSHQHRNTTIKSIRLQVDFEEIGNWTDERFNVIDDTSDDAIELWRENRALWSRLDEAVSATVQEYIKQVQRHSVDSKLKTMSVPIAAMTEFAHHSSHASAAGTCEQPEYGYSKSTGPRHSIGRHVDPYQIPRGFAETDISRDFRSSTDSISPNESASKVSTGTITQIIHDLEKLKASKKKDSKKKKDKTSKKDSKSATVLDYISRT